MVEREREFKMDVERGGGVVAVEEGELGGDEKYGRHIL